MSSPAPMPRRVRLARAGVALALVTAPFGACTEVESSTVEGYEPTTLEEVRGSDFQRVIFTAEGARRLALRTGTVTTATDGRTAVPYAALIYDAAGRTYVYTSPAPRTFLRDEVKVADVRGDRALLTEGPPPGTTVVTTGAAEVYGAELDVPGSH